MKNKYLIIVLLLGLAGMFTIQSCTKDESPTPVIYKAAVPMNPTPAEGAVVPLDGTSYVLKWEGTTTTSWDVYFGPYGDVKLVKTGLTGNTYTVTVEEGGEYEWYVQTKDANGIVSSNITGPARDPWYFYINTAPTAPVLTTPADAAVGFSVAGALKWTSSDAEGDAIKYDVFISTSETPALAATGLTAATYSPTMVASTKYYWKVVATDSHGASATSAVHSFTTGLEPIMMFTGLYLCDEPAEAYSYDVTFAKASATTVKTTNYWNSGWTATFTIDLATNAFSMTSYTFSAGWTGVESGVVDPATGTMTGYYSLWKGGVVQETGIHTYTKK
jgi:hypothetical protein